MKKLPLLESIILFFTIIPSVAFSNALPLENCRTQVDKILKAYSGTMSLDRFAQIASGDYESEFDGTQFFRISNADRESKRNPELARFTKNTVTRYHFLKSCEPKVNYELARRDGFGESELSKQMSESREKKRKGIFYFWSPLMPYSITGIKEIRSVAKELNLDVTVLVDEAADQKLIDVLLSNNEVSKEDIQSLDREGLRAEFRQRLSLVHFPTIFFYENGSLRQAGLPGYKSRDQYKDVFKSTFALRGE